MASGRARWASKKISAAHLTLPRQPCHRRIGRSARSVWAGRSPARKDSQSGGGPRALAASNSNAHSTLHSPTCRLRRNGRLGCKPSWRTCNGRCSDARARPRQRAGTTRPPRRQSLPTRRPPRQRPGKRPRRKRGREPGSPTPPREQRPDLPVVFEWLDVPEQERRCPDCGTAYVPCGHKISWLYELVWNALVRKVVRQRYGPDCDCCSARPVSAPPAPRLGTSQLGTSVWAWCLVQVYALFRPQAAVARDLAALGLRVPQSTLSTGLRRLAHLFEPLAAAIGEYPQQQPVAQADETSWPVQWLAPSEDDNKDPPPRGRPKPKFWLWACLAGDTVRMRILPTRGLDSARQLLDSLVGQGGLIVLVCDCYSTYKAFAKQFPNLVVRSHCWVHIRRNFVRAGTGHPELKAWAQEWVERIGALFQLNRQRLQQWAPQQPLERQSGAFQALQQQLQARVEELFERAREEGGDRKLDWILLDQVGQGRSQHGAELARVDAQGRALGTLLSHRESLSRFVADPRIPLDNNLSERVLRGPVIARYTSFGSGGRMVRERRVCCSAYSRPCAWRA